MEEVTYEKDDSVNKNTSNFECAEDKDTNESIKKSKISNTGDLEQNLQDSPSCSDEREKSEYNTEESEKMGKNEEENIECNVKENDTNVKPKKVMFGIFDKSEFYKSIPESQRRIGTPPKRSIDMENKNEFVSKCESEKMDNTVSFSNYKSINSTPGDNDSGGRDKKAGGYTSIKNLFWTTEEEEEDNVTSDYYQYGLTGWDLFGSKFKFGNKCNHCDDHNEENESELDLNLRQHSSPNLYCGEFTLEGQNMSTGNIDDIFDEYIAKYGSNGGDLKFATFKDFDFSGIINEIENDEKTYSKYQDIANQNNNNNEKGGPKTKVQGSCAIKLANGSKPNKVTDNKQNDINNLKKQQKTKYLPKISTSKATGNDGKDVFLSKVSLPNYSNVSSDNQTAKNLRSGEAKSLSPSTKITSSPKKVVAAQFPQIYKREMLKLEQKKNKLNEQRRIEKENLEKKYSQKSNNLTISLDKTKNIKNTGKSIKSSNILQSGKSNKNCDEDHFSDVDDDMFVISASENTKSHNDKIVNKFDFSYCNPLSPSRTKFNFEKYNAAPKGTSDVVPQELLNIITHPPESFIYRAICGCSPADFPRETLEPIITELKTYLEKCVKCGLVNGSEYIQHIISNLEDEITQQPTKYEEKLMECDEKIEKFSKQLSERQSYWKTLKENLEQDKKNAIDELRERYKKEMDKLDDFWSSDKAQNKYNKPSTRLLNLRQLVKSQMEGHCFEDAILIANQMNELEQEETNSAAFKMQLDYEHAVIQKTKKFQSEKEALEMTYEFKLNVIISSENDNIQPIISRLEMLKKMKTRAESDMKRVVRKKTPKNAPPTILNAAKLALNSKLSLPPLKKNTVSRVSI